MALRVLVACVVMLATAGELYGMEVGGAVLPETLRVDSQELVLNGAGLRKKFFIKVYAGGLYLKERSSEAGGIIDADEPMAIRLHFIYDGVSREDLVKAWNEGFDAATGGAPGPLEERIKAFNSLFVQPAQKGDVYDFVYMPEQGVRVVIKGDTVKVIPGLDFKKALFAIWLGEKPADSGLKKGMLGE